MATRGKGRANGHATKEEKARRRKAIKDALSVNPKTGDAESEPAAAPLLIPKSRDMRHHLTVCEIAKAKLDKANAELKNCYKAADEAGIDPKVIRASLSIKNKPALSNKAYFTQLSLALQELGTEVQINVHDAKYADAVAEAKVRGFGDGKAGRPQSHAWVKGSPAARSYDDAYASGQLECMPIDEAARARLRAEGAGQAAH